MADPMVQRRLVGKGVRAARTDKGLSQSEAAAKLDWSASKLTRIERGDTPASKTDLEAVLRLYEVLDTPLGEELIARGIEARKKPWWQPYLDPTAGTRDGRLGRLLSFESEANVINAYAPSLVPGLLQTEDYSREVLAHFTARPDRVDTLARLRARRYQEVFKEGRRHPRVRFVLDEAVILRRVGAPEKASIMVEQLRYIKEQVGVRGIDLRVLPFAAGMHAGLRGPITIYEFDAASGPEDVAFVRDEEFVEGAERARYLDTFEALYARALESEETTALIDAAIAAMSAGEGVD
ncbi:helix-turn-helix domain-containing protein [Embleya scabrispora]|uniref:helix-turn-helix domain-containing protein n=1 Tax=Embleya scabrispora TaxID=159449 RepID=UPI00036C0ECA|nr:helix-turn-helix transcriptional regulator [Embleya scabrispora]MYS80045.1 helix-turn-helix domain-containing protein [Streptomyces sp. SID5474]